MTAHFLLQIFQRFTQHISHNANAGYHKQKVRHGFHLLSTEVLRNSVQPAATQWSAFHCRQTKLNHIYCCPSILFHTVNEHIRIFVQIPITGAADSFSHGCAVPDLRRSACLLPAQRAASSTPSKRELFFSVRSSYTRNKTSLLEERLKSAPPVAESADEKRRRLSAEGRRKEFRTAGGKLHALEEGALFWRFFHLGDKSRARYRDRNKYSGYTHFRCVLNREGRKEKPTPPRFKTPFISC